MRDLNYNANGKMAVVDSDLLDAQLFAGREGDWAVPLLEEIQYLRARNLFLTERIDDIKSNVAGWLGNATKRRSIFVPPHGQADFNAAIAKLRKKWRKV